MFADFRLLNGRTSLKVIKLTSLSVSLVLFIGLLDNNGRLGDPTLPVREKKMPGIRDAALPFCFVRAAGSAKGLQESRSGLRLSKRCLQEGNLPHRFKHRGFLRWLDPMRVKPDGEHVSWRCN